MKNSFKIFAVVLLLFNGAAAIYGGLNLVVYPNGTSLQLSPDLLQPSPFTNYFIPGLILFIANGLLSLFAGVTVIARLQKSYLYVFIQGCILTGWIIIQAFMLQTVLYYQVIFGITGLLLMLCGWKLNSFTHRLPQTRGVKLA